MAVAETKVVVQAQVVSQAAIDSKQVVQSLALFDSSGNPITLTGTDDLLTGYVIDGTPYTAILVTDKVIEALAKLEASTSDLNDRVTALEGA